MPNFQAGECPICVHEYVHKKHGQSSVRVQPENMLSKTESHTPCGTERKRNFTCHTMPNVWLLTTLSHSFAHQLAHDRDLLAYVIHSQLQPDYQQSLSDAP